MGGSEIKPDDCPTRFGIGRHWRAWIRLPVLTTMLAGCISDTALLRENAAVALRSTRFQARSNLGCDTVAVKILSEQEVPGAPWGFLYSDYRIQAIGCGRSAIYWAECRDQQLCDVLPESH